MIGALIAALTGATAVILDKAIISKEKVNFLTYMVLMEIIVFVFTIGFFPFFGLLDLNNFNIIYAISFLAVIGIAFLYNFLYFYSINHERVADVEPLAMLYPLIGTVMAASFYHSERNLFVLIFAIVAGIALVVSRIEKRHLDLNRYSLAMLGFIFLMAIESLFVKKLLEIASPVALYGIRTGILAILFVIFMSATFKGVSGKKFFHILIASATIASHYLLMYYSFSNLGIVMTNLVFLLIPVFILFGSKFILKERLDKKRIISSIIILICIAGAIFFGGNA